MLLQSFVSETTWVGSCFSGGSRLETRDISGSCCVTSRGKLFSHLRSSSSLLRRTARYAAGSVMLRRLQSLLIRPVCLSRS